MGFLRGTGGTYDAAGKWAQDPCKLGFATSVDGRHWEYFPENPVIHQDDGGGGSKGVYRPHFVGYLGDGKYLLCWSEGTAKIIYIGNVASAAGRFVLDVGGLIARDGDFSLIPKFWGVLKFQTNFEFLQRFGIFVDAEAMLQINLTEIERTETLWLEGIPGDTIFTV